MTNKSTKSALLLSSISLLLCFAMLLGTTFAWFTDSVTSSGNKIQAGTLKVDLELLDKESDIWSSIKKDKTPLFDYDKWEPGYTEAKVLKIDNEGSLALEWKASFISESDLGILANVIDVYVKSYGVLADDSAVAYPGNRNLDGYTKVGTVAEFVNTIEQTTYGTLEAGQSAYLGIALKMQESAGNEYQDQSLGAFDIQISATQLNSEEDSFGKDYDEDAEYPAIPWDGSVDTSWFDASKTEFVISNGAQLAGMAKLGAALGGKTVTLDSDVDLGGKNWTPIRIFAPEQSFIFDGGNHTIYNLNVTSGSDNGMFDHSVGTIKNLKLSDAQIKSGGRSAILAGRHYGDIINCHVKDSTVEDSYWAAGGIVGQLNSGNVKNCSITNVNVKSKGGVGGIVGVLNETKGTRSIENCSVNGGTIENTGAYGSSYPGGGIVGMINISNSTVNIKGCSSTATLKGNYIYEICPPADSDITLNIN